MRNSFDVDEEQIQEYFLTNVYNHIDKNFADKVVQKSFEKSMIKIIPEYIYILPLPKPADFPQK